MPSVRQLVLLTLVKTVDVVLLKQTIQNHPVNLVDIHEGQLPPTNFGEYVAEHTSPPVICEFGGIDAETLAT